MSAFANWPISRKLMAAFAAVIGIIFVSSAIIYDRLRVIDHARMARTHTMNILETLQTAMDAMVDQETGVRGYLIGGNEAFLEPYRRGAEVFSAAIGKIRHLIADDQVQQRRIDELETEARRWRSEVAEREIALMARFETREEARALEGSMAGKHIMDQIRAKVAEIELAERDLLEKRVAAQKEAFATAYTMTVLGGAVSLMVAILVGGLLTQGITVPITRMTNAMVALAKGDTSVEVPEIGRGDELGAMASAVQVFKESMIQGQRAQTELAHVNRVTSMGQLTASIAHEVNQPIAAVVTNAEAALRWMRNQPANLEEVRLALEAIAKDGKRAGEVIGRIRALIRKAPPRKNRFDLNEAILDVIALVRSEVLRHGVTLDTQLVRDLPVQGDRVQIQQVILNLVFNAVEAMDAIQERPRELNISTERGGSGDVRVTVRDNGPGLDPNGIDQLFEAFYTTKPSGMGMGLAICRSIIEAHGGRMWASTTESIGAVFHFTLPVDSSRTSAEQNRVI